MQYAITTVVIIIVVQLLMSGLFSRSKRLKKTDGNGVYLPDFMLIIGIIGTLIFTAFFCCSLIFDPLIWVAAIFGFFIALGAILIVTWKNCYILYDDEGFTQHTFWGRKRRFTYDEVTGYTGKPGLDYRIYVGKKKISVDKMAINNTEFFCFIEEKCGKLERKKKSDIFNGHIENPGEFIFIYALLFVFILGVSLFIGIDALRPVTEDDCENYNIVFTKCEVKNSDLHLYPEGDLDKFIIYGYEGNIDDIKKACKKKKEFNVWAEHYEPDNKAPYNEICELSCGDKVFYTFDDVTRQNRNDMIPVLLVFLGILLVWSLFVVFSIILGRNPKKYPRLVKLFFQPGYINCDG